MPPLVLKARHLCMYIENASAFSMEFSGLEVHWMGIPLHLGLVVKIEFSCHCV